MTRNTTIDLEAESGIKAAREGRKDGIDRVRTGNFGVDDGPLTPADVEAWFAPGQEEPDHALINALSKPLLAEVLGLTPAQVEARGKEFRTALWDYNDGFRAGARAEVESESRRDESP